jgi:hypothetical protein
MSSAGRRGFASTTFPAGRGRAFASLAAFAVLAAGCMETRRSLGDDCLKNDDCLSGVCSQLRCASAPPTIDTPAVNDAATGSSSEDASSGETGALVDAEADSPWDDGDSGD